MKVSLIDFTGRGYLDPAKEAATILIFTKNTRLQMSPGLLDEIRAWPEEKKLKELEYMAHTIPSSHEFVDYTFMIEGITRAFSHQFVRSRTWSFAQQTMRVLDVSTGPGWSYATGPTIKDDNAVTYDHTMHEIDRAYKKLIEHGAAIEDARGILPTNILTNIVAKGNMRSFVELVRKRSSSRTQGEYRAVLDAMKDQVRLVHPWIDLFIDRTADRALNELNAKVLGLPLSAEEKTNMVKLIDQARNNG